MIFFFQAEDGIRDWSVTGVQTCALPILEESSQMVGTVKVRARESDGVRYVEVTQLAVDPEHQQRGIGSDLMALAEDRARRSEERRVGKECRSRWGADHGKKETTGRRH